jgi:hypothetical protein
MNTPVSVPANRARTSIPGTGTISSDRTLAFGASVPRLPVTSVNVAPASVVWNTWAPVET